MFTSVYGVYFEAIMGNAAAIPVFHGLGSQYGREDIAIVTTKITTITIMHTSVYLIILPVWYIELVYPRTVSPASL